MIRFLPTALGQSEALFQEYLAGLPSVFDNFLEDHILESDFYGIRRAGREIGYCAIHDETLLTQFYLVQGAWRHAQHVFAELLRAFPVRCAYVPSCDEAMLSICMDFRCAVELQAYGFRYGGEPVRPAEYPRSMLRLTDPSEWEAIERRTEGLFDVQYYLDKQEPGFLYELYELAQAGEILGYGVREAGRIFTGYHATGMYTLPAYRGRHVGRSILLHLRDICEAAGYRALPGCWYWNTASKRTLESAGYVSKSRLLKIHFSQVRP